MQECYLNLHLVEERSFKVIFSDIFFLFGCFWADIWDFGEEWKVQFWDWAESNDFIGGDNWSDDLGIIDDFGVILLHFYWNVDRQEETGLKSVSESKKGSTRSKEFNNNNTNLMKASIKREFTLYISLLWLIVGKKRA